MLCRLIITTAGGLIEVYSCTRKAAQKWCRLVPRAHKRLRVAAVELENLNLTVLTVSFPQGKRHAVSLLASSAHLHALS